MVESIESRYLAREEAVYMEAFMGSPRPEPLKLRKSITCRGTFGPRDRTKSQLEVPWARARRNMPKSDSREHQRKKRHCPVIISGHVTLKHTGNPCQ
jgi:hypothetical protein